MKLKVDQLTSAKAIKVARFLSSVVGVAQARQLRATERRQWRRELTFARGKSVEAPIWLWRSVADLIGIHETAYLDHCRIVRKQGLPD